MAKYDITIIGSGPCGYVAAIWAARCGLNVAVIEKDLLGGTCLNKGCIPTKTLLYTAELFSNIKKAENYGIKADSVSLDFNKAFERKEKVVEQLRSGISALFKARNIELFKGEARLLGPNAVEVNPTPAHRSRPCSQGRDRGGVNKERIDSKNILIATGSQPIEIPIFKFDKEFILSSDDIMSLRQLPESILIVGGGAIGCEYATLYNSFGKKVVVVEMLNNLLPTLDSEVGKRLEAVFRKRGIEVVTKTKVEKIDKKGTSIEASLSDGKTYNLKKALISIGRKPDSENLRLQNIGIKVDKGRIVVDEYLKTNIPNIYAAGDVIGGILLAHVASHEGIVAVDNIKGEKKKMDYTAVPNCIFTAPEIATVGLSDREARTKTKDVKISRFPYTALGKAHAIGETEGFVKIVGEGSSGKILGIHIMGPHATDLIGEAALALKQGLRSADLMDTIHAHPTLTEAISEAAFNFYGKALHLI